LESRTPFLDKAFVESYLNVPVQYRLQNAFGIEKSLLRNAFAQSNLLPESVLWRTKEAFSDGVSGAQNSWHKIIQKHIDEKVSDTEYNENKEKVLLNKPQLKESYYYRKVFEKYYPNKSYTIPHFWMPKWTESVDPSARELK
jgi:asparagine synthase (glutamine-hydrolysing)